MRLIAMLSLLLLTALTNPANAAQSTDKWVVSWVGSAQGPYPVGNPSAQPDMKKGVTRIRARIPGVRVIGATLTTALGATKCQSRFPRAGRKAQGA